MTNHKVIRLEKSNAVYSPPLSEKEISDVKKALKSKGKIYDDVDDLIKDLYAEK